MIFSLFSYLFDNSSFDMGKTKYHFRLLGKYPISIQSTYGSKLLINQNIEEIKQYKNR